MKIAFVRVRKYGLRGASEDAARKARGSEKASSSSKLLILALQARGLAADCSEWQFWRGQPPKAAGGLLPVQDFVCDESGHSAGLARAIEEQGQPDILWIEGRTLPAHLQQVFDLCPRSFTINYSKHWRPWQVEGLERYRLSLTDEDWQSEKLMRRQPSVHAGRWDKLVDYEAAHKPLQIDKRYDICYVAALRRRKNHELLLEAMAALPERRLTAVFVGGGGGREELEQLAKRLGVAVEFAGEVSKDEVNRYVNQSRIGVMCARKDAAPRAILEYMAAGVPVLVNAELMAGARYVGPGAGLVRGPEDFAAGMAELLDGLDSYAPRAYLLEHHSVDAAVRTFLDILEQAGYQGS